jgi:hypothetical protein
MPTPLIINANGINIFALNLSIHELITTNPMSLIPIFINYAFPIIALASASVSNP